MRASRALQSIVPLLLLISVISVLPALGAAPAPVAIPVGGVVQGPGGSPVQGAQVRLVPFASNAEEGRLELEGKVYLDAPSAKATAVTDADGGFRLQAPEAGMWKVVVEARGLVPAEMELTPLLAETELPAVRLERDAGLVVRVAAADGSPLPGARVRVDPSFDFRAAFTAAWRPPARSALTDARGTAVLPRAGRESLLVRAGVEGQPVARQEGVRGGSVALRLPSGTSREIRVQDAAGKKPEAGVLVRIGDDLWAAGRTSTDGLFSIPLASSRRERVLLIAADGRRLATYVAPPGKHEKGPRILRLPTLETFSGRVVSAATGRPVGGALVWGEEPGEARRSGVDGAYALPLPPMPANFEVTVHGASPGYFTAMAQLGPGQRRGPTLSLEPALAAGGVVVDESGKPVPGVEIRATPQYEGGPRSASILGSGGTARTSSTGRFRLGLLAAGLGHDLRLSKVGFAPGSAEIPPLTPGRVSSDLRSDLRIVLRKGRTAFGRILNQAEEPVPGARVVLSPAARTGDRMGLRLMRSAASGGRGLEASAGADGRFEIRDLPAGTYELAASGPGYAPLTVPGLTIPEGAGSTDLGTVLLTPGVAIEGQVVDPEGRPIPEAEVTVAEAAGSMNSMLRQHTDPPSPVLTGADGFFRVEDRRPGETLDLSAYRAGYAGAGVPGVRVPAEKPVRIVLQPSASVEGRVVDSDGRPVAGATVFAFASDPPRMGRFRTFFPGRGEPVRSDEDGFFRIGNVEPGSIEVRATAAGYQASQLKNLEVRPGQELKGVEVVLSPGAVVEGRVLSPSGKPVPGAQVRAVELDARGGGFNPTGAITDGDGRYRMDGIAPGPRAIQAEHPDYRRTVRDLDVRPGENNLDLTLEGGAEVRGRVVDEGGAPVANARVLLRQGWRSGDLPSDSSGPDGSFTLSSVPEGTYQVTAQKEGFATDPEGQEVVVAGGPVGGVEIRLSRGGAIVGQLLGLEFTELARVQIRLQGDSRGGTVAPDGSYRIDNVAPGSWRVVATLTEGSRQAEGEATLEPGMTEARLDLTFGEGHTLTGRVLRNGQPVVGVGVSLGSRDSSSRFVSTDHEGRFRFAELPAAQYRLMVLIGRGESHHVEELDLESDRDVLVELRAVTVSGRVTDADDRRPLANAEVSLVIPPGAETSSANVSTTTDSRGFFQLRGLSEGTWRLKAELSGYAPEETTVQIDDTPVEGVELALRATEGLTLAVVLSSGRPPQMVRTALLDSAGQVVASGMFPVGEDGRVRMTSVAPGAWELILDAEGAAPLSVPVTAPGDAGRVVLPLPGRLEVSVPALAGGTVRGILRLTDAAGRPFRAPWGSHALGEFELTDGTRELERLPVGTWRLTVTAGDGRVWNGTATVVPGAVQRVTLE